jgi:hypothetical protein
MRRAELYEARGLDAVRAPVSRQNAAEMLRSLTIPLVAFLVVTALAELLGAANLGTAATFGQIAFVLAVGGVLLREA